jgi:threonine/homoserine/homoserine lactone efflux protein
LNLEVLSAFILSSTALTLMPGPDIIYVISQSVLFGKRTGILISLGLVTGLLIHTCLVIFGLATIMDLYPNSIFIVKFLGSFYLIYLGINSLNKSRKRKGKLKKKSFLKEENGGFHRGLLMNLLNPKVSLFFLALFPGFLFSENLSNQVQFLILGIIFFVQALIIFVLVTFLANYFFKFSDNASYLRRSIFKLQGIILILIAIFILFT